MSHAVQKLLERCKPVATCRQLPYSHYDAILIVTSFVTELATPTVTDEPTLRTPYRVY